MLCCMPRTRAGLVELDIGFNRFTRLPPVLAAATRLTRLSIEGNEDLCITAADVDQVLACMPALRSLDADGISQLPRGVQEHLERRLPHVAVQLAESDGSGSGSDDGGSESESTTDSGSQSDDSSDIGE